jgi:glycolate oxidase iron-sulfur subunit
MQTSFSIAQLADPDFAEADAILRRCVHCGFCNSACPTFAELGNELDGPRGRIYLIKDMLQAEAPPDPAAILHLDRCLSCLACVDACPSGVDYGRLIDHARNVIETQARRPRLDRWLRALIANTLPYPRRFRALLALARLTRPLAGTLGRRGKVGERLAAMFELAPEVAPARGAIAPGLTVTPEGARRARVALLHGCVQSVLDPEINLAAVRLLSRFGIEVVFAEGEGCCGAVVQHMGREEQSRALARRNIDSWIEEMDGEGLDAILVTTSGCGTSIKEYGHLFRRDPAYAEKAARVSALALDVTEFLVRLALPAGERAGGLVVAYHSACSLQHGQRVTREPAALLRRAGFEVRDVPEARLCCGSAGTYNLLQPAVARRLRDRKVRNLESTAPDVIASGNIGCIAQIASATIVPVVHIVELLDWAYGGGAATFLQRRGAP